MVSYTAHQVCIHAPNGVHLTISIEGSADHEEEDPMALRSAAGEAADRIESALSEWPQGSVPKVLPFVRGMGSA